jgi:hypothetical protein
MLLPVTPQLVLKRRHRPSKRPRLATAVSQTLGFDGVLQLKVSCTTSSASTSELKEPHPEHSTGHRTGRWPGPTDRRRRPHSITKLVVGAVVNSAGKVLVLRREPGVTRAPRVSGASTSRQA